MGIRTSETTSLALPVYSAKSVKQVPTFGAGVLYVDLGLKMRVYVIRRLAVVSDYNGALVENGTIRARRIVIGHASCKPTHVFTPHRM